MSKIIMKPVVCGYCGGPLTSSEPYRDALGTFLYCAACYGTPELASRGQVDTPRPEADLKP